LDETVFVMKCSRLNLSYLIKIMMQT
jgi:hypothetical protein